MRFGVFFAVALWLAPVITVGVIGFRVSAIPAVLISLVLAAAFGWLASKPLAACLAPALAGSTLRCTIVGAIAACAIVLIARESVYMADNTQPAYSIIPADPWRVEHSCMSAYFEAARFNETGSDNLYDPKLYQSRHIGALKVDSYHYPPPFLLVPRVLRLITTDFFQLRAIWFAIQALVFAGVIAGLGVWIGEAIGAYALVGGLFVLSAPSTIYSLQMGNFQTTAMALGALAFVFLVTRREVSGAICLAYLALSKIFPGLLVVYLLFARRWRAVAWTAAAATVLIALSFWVVGRGPWLDFLHHEVPGILNGQAFPQSERPSVIQSNQSIYGLTVRLRYLGTAWLDQPLGLRVASVYGLLILGLAAFAGWKSRLNVNSVAGRLVLVQTAVALMSLASFRSPFVGGMYGLVSTLWLLTLLCASATGPKEAVLWTLAFCLCAVGNYLTSSPTFDPTPFWLIGSAAVLAVGVAASVWTVLRSISRAGGAEMEPRPYLVGPEGSAEIEPRPSLAGHTAARPAQQTPEAGAGSVAR